MAKNDFRIDGHKLMLHPERVFLWLKGRLVVPIYLEMSPSGSCNHRCSFCGMDFMGYKARFLRAERLVPRLKELGAAGVRAVMYAGEGEPFLNKEMAQIAESTKAAGMDVAFTTNGVLLTPENARCVLPVTSWIKVSCNAGRPETYARVHGTDEKDFAKVMENIGEAARLRKELCSSCTIGFQLLLLPENCEEALELARRVRELGADYLVIKPYSIHRKSLSRKYRDLQYSGYEELARRLAEYDTETFKVIFRHEAIARREEKMLTYGRCCALPFWGYVDSGGTMWGCLRHIGEERFAYGNILDTPICDVLEGARRLEAIRFAEERLDISDCHVDCRMDAINAYLWDLRHPGPHDNFI